MKTIKEWLDTLPEPYRTKALNNTSINKLSKETKSLSEALEDAFIWQNSKEGELYWGSLFYLIEYEEQYQ